MKRFFMLEAVGLSLRAVRRKHGGPFGAVVVRNQEIIGRGWNKVVVLNDPTAHAEVVAIRAACRKLGRFHLQDCDLYTTCEPCPMCLSAIYWARIRKVFFANTREDAAAIGFDDAFIYRQVALPWPKRKLKMLPFLRERALPVFEQWAALPDKVRY